MKHPQITFFAGVKYFLILHFLLTAFSSQAWISFTMSVHKGCYPLEVEFTNTSTEGKTFDWDFGDGTYFTGTDTSHIYTEPGVYTVTMHAYDQNGWYIWYAESQVIVWGNIGFFEMTKEDLCPNEPVSFDPLLDTVICHWDFGDGRFSTDKYPVHYYQDPGLYIVRLTGMTPCDTAVIIDSVYIRDDVPLQGHLQMVLSDNTICPGDRVYGFIHAEDYLTNYHWTLGDGQTCIYDNFENKYFESGEYPIAATVSNGCGSDTTLQQIIEVKEGLPVTGDFFNYIRPETNCPGDVVRFTFQNQWSTTGSMHRFYWNFGDGTSTTTDYQTAYHTYYDPGTYNYSVVVENLCHSDTAFYGVIEIQEDYSGSEEYYLYHYYDEICTGTPVIMRVSGDYPNLLHDFNWDFGDGTTVYGPYYAYHAYEYPGMYEVTVNFQNGCGEQFFVSKTVTVNENTLPNRNIEVYTYHDVYCLGQKVGFYLSPFQDLNIHKAIWQFGDGNSMEGYGFSTYHQYQTAGIYQYEVTVYSNCGYDTTLTGQVEIRDDLLKTYSTWLEVVPDHACPGEEIGISLYPYSGFSGLTVYDLGDGTIMEGEESIKHIYSSEGTYEINAYLTDGCGNEISVSRTIEVSNLASPDPFDYEVDDYYEACPGDTIIFKALHTGASFSVGFGDGSYANMSEIQLIGDKQYHIARHAYEETGTYIGAINITNSCGNQVTQKITIVITDEAIYDNYDLISVSPETFYGLSYCVGEDIHFYSGIGTSIEWDFGDHSSPVITSHAQIPSISHTYDVPGQYIVRIKTTNNCGNTSTMFRSIYVQECTVGMHDNIIFQSNFIHVFPNPSTGSFNLEFNSNENDVTVNLFTINGQLVHKETIKSVDKSQQIRLSTEFLPAGMYILEATTKTKTNTKKVVVF